MRFFEAGSKHPVTQLQFRPDGGGVTASLRRTGHLVTWDIASGTVERMSLARAVSCFSYAPDGAQVIVGYADGVARVHQLPGLSSADLIVIGHGDPVRAVAFSPVVRERTRWVAAAGEGDLHLRNLDTGEIRADFDDDGHYSCVTFDPTGESVAVVNDRAGALTGFQVRPWRELFRLHFIPFTTTRRLVWLPDLDAIVKSDETHVTCQTSTNRTVWDVPMPAPRVGVDLALFPNGRFLLTANASTVVKLLDPATGAVAREYDWGIGKVSAVAVSPDGTMAAAGGEKGRVVVWDLDA